MSLQIAAQLHCVLVGRSLPTPLLARIEPITNRWLSTYLIISVKPFYFSLPFLEPSSDLPAHPLDLDRLMDPVCHDLVYVILLLILMNLWPFFETSGHFFLEISLFDFPRMISSI